MDMIHFTGFCQNTGKSVFLRNFRKNLLQIGFYFKGKHFLPIFNTPDNMIIKIVDASASIGISCFMYAHTYSIYQIARKVCCLQLFNKYI